VAQLRPFADWNLAFVTHGTHSEAAEFRESQRSPHPFLSDPRAELYEEAGFGRAGFSQVISPNVLLRCARAIGHGMGRPNADPLRMGGALVMASGGEVTWHRPARDVADNAPVDQIRAALGL
jgi:hypothetical protein